MTTQQTSYTAPSAVECKPLVLIVQSPHNVVVRTQNLDTKLKEVDGLTYTRSLFIARMAEVFGRMGPTYLYGDGWRPGDARAYNDFLPTLVQHHIEYLQKIQAEAGQATDAAKPRLVIPSQEWYEQTILRKNLGRYKHSSLGLDAEAREWAKGLSHIMPSAGVDLVKFEDERFLSMISYSMANGADITLKPGEYDPELFVDWLKAEQKGDTSFRPEFYRQRDNNLYSHVEEDFKDGRPKFAIVYFGSDHQMVRFGETKDFDVFWADFRKDPSGLVRLVGTLPGRTNGIDRVKAQQSFKTILEGEKTKVYVNLSFRPRQLMETAS